MKLAAYVFCPGKQDSYDKSLLFSSSPMLMAHPLHQDQRFNIFFIYSYILIREVVFKMGYNEGTRGDFHTLCPGNKIKRQVGRARFIYFWVYCITTFIDNTMSWGCCQIVTWMALKATWLQQHISG